MSRLAVLRGRLEAHLQREGLRRTRQREVLLEVLVEAGRHLSLDELLALARERLPGLGTATVYRTMKLFVAAGVAEERRFRDGQARYEPAAVDEDAHHDHLICVHCGRIIEFEDPLIEERQRAVAAHHGMRIVNHRLDIWGECGDPERCEHRDGEVD